MEKLTTGHDGPGHTRFGQDTADGSTAYYDKADNTQGEAERHALVGPSSEGTRRRREGPEDGPQCEAQPFAPSMTGTSSPEVPEDAWFDAEFADVACCEGCGSAGSGSGLCGFC